jgi:hypothetical protein
MFPLLALSTELFSNADLPVYTFEFFGPRHGVKATAV